MPFYDHYLSTSSLSLAISSENVKSHKKFQRFSRKLNKKLFNLFFYECGKILKYKVLKNFMPKSFSTQTTKGTLKIRYEYTSEMRW